MGIKRSLKKILGIPERRQDLIVELPSETEKKLNQRIRLQNEKIRDDSIEIRELKKNLAKLQQKKKKGEEDKKIIAEVLKKAKERVKEVKQTKAVYKLIYPRKKPFIQYANGKRRIYDGFEINETKDGTPLFRMRFYSKELKKVIPLQLDATELTFFFQSIIGLATQHNTGIINLNVDEVEGKPVFITSEIGFIKEAQLTIARLTRDKARKDDEIRALKGKMGMVQELQAEQEKDLADMDMAVRYAQKDAENKAAKLESVMHINLAVEDKLKQDHIQKGMSELKMAQSLRTLQAYESNNQDLNERLEAAYSSDAYERGKEDTITLLERVTKQILSTQAMTKTISSPHVRVAEEKKEEK